MFLNFFYSIFYFFKFLATLPSSLVPDFQLHVMERLGVKIEWFLLKKLPGLDQRHCIKVFLFKCLQLTVFIVLLNFQIIYMVQYFIVVKILISSFTLCIYISLYYLCFFMCIYIMLSNMLLWIVLCYVSLHIIHLLLSSFTFVQFIHDIYCIDACRSIFIPTCLS